MFPMSRQWRLSLLAGIVLAAAHQVALADTLAFIEDPNGHTPREMNFPELEQNVAQGWTADDARVLANGNEVLEIDLSSGNGGSGYFYHAGVHDTTDVNGAAFTADPAFGGDGIEHENAARFSLWIRSDPDDPATTNGFMIDVLKMEFWFDALGTNLTTPLGRALDTSINAPLQPAPSDPLGPPQSGDTAFEGDWMTDEWTQFVYTYEVNELDFPGGQFDLDLINEVRFVLFEGNYGGTNSGKILVDNVRMEFADTLAALGPLDMTVPGPQAGTPGDFDGDGDVDGDDFLLWQANFGGAGPTGDADGDGDVDGDDFLIWQSNFGSGTGSSSGAVPEPTGIALALLAALALAAHTRNCRKQ